MVWDKLRDRLLCCSKTGKMGKNKTCARTAVRASLISFWKTFKRSPCIGTRKLRWLDGFTCFFRVICPLQRVFSPWDGRSPSPVSFLSFPIRGNRSRWLSQVCSKVMMPLWHRSSLGLYVAAGALRWLPAAYYADLPTTTQRATTAFVFQEGSPWLLFFAQLFVKSRSFGRSLIITEDI